MNLTENILIEIFNNLGFEIVEDPIFRNVVVMDPQSAFDFSAITGANYMLTKNGVTMKGRNETFIHRAVFQDNTYIYSPGLFERDKYRNIIEGNSADELNRKYPHVFHENKKIILYMIENGKPSNVEDSVYESLKSNNLDSRHYLLFKFFESGSSQEPFFEYLTSYYYIQKGYIVENQAPWFQQNYYYNGRRLNGGIPDFSAFKIPCLKVLIENGLFDIKQGMLINRLPVTKNFKSAGNIAVDVNEPPYELIIGEVKSDIANLNQAINQAVKYSQVDLADKIYTIIPNCPNNSTDEIGEIYLSNNKLVVKEASNQLHTNNDKRLIDEDWITANIKINLLGNVNFSILTELISSKLRITSSDLKSFHLLKYVEEIEIADIIKLI